MAEQKWYKPVNLGQHYLNFIAEENVSPEEMNQYFDAEKEGFLSQQFEQELESLAEDWKKYDDGSISPEFQNDQYFIPHRDYKVEYTVAGFSDDSVNVMFFFEYGASRWHRYNALLKNVIVPRNSLIDSIFNMEYYDTLYTKTYQGIGHGSTETEMESVLGNEYYEYGGQSPQLRNIYYEDPDVEICVQDGIVKYIKEGRPAWMDSDNVEKHHQHE